MTQEIELSIMGSSTDPAADLDDIIAQHLAPVARKLDLILAG